MGPGVFFFLREWRCHEIAEFSCGELRRAFGITKPKPEQQRTVALTLGGFLLIFFTALISLIVWMSLDSTVKKRKPCISLRESRLFRPLHSCHRTPWHERGVVERVQQVARSRTPLFRYFGQL